MNEEIVLINENPGNTNSLKLGKNGKGYTWEIKLDKIDIKEMERINEEMIKRFPNK